MLQAVIRAKLQTTLTAKVSAQIAGSGADYEVYTGAYNVAPDFDGQALSTRGKIMTDDVTVQPIAVSRVTNTQGGRTVYIGGNLDG